MPAPSMAASAAAIRHLEGRVTAIDRSARTFTVRDAERGSLKVTVTASTKFERTSVRRAARRARRSTSAPRR